MLNIRKALKRLNSRKISESSLNMEEFLGRGSYGKVFKAKWEGRQVAVKIFFEKDNRRQNDAKLINEIKLMTRVFHPNIVRLFGYSSIKDDCGKHFALVMEKIDGGSLDIILHEKPQIKYNLWHVFWWLLQCARGLSYMHSMEEKLVHRDIKSPNLLLSYQGVIKIGDFGTARVMCSQMTDNRGSIPWMAPEVFTPQKYTEKCDVYSFAHVLWELLARKIPWTDSNLNPYAIAYNVAEKKIRLPLFVDCPKRIEQLMTNCWAQNPEDRPSMKEVELICQTILNYCPEPVCKDVLNAPNNGNNNIEGQSQSNSSVRSAIDSLNEVKWSEETNESVITDLTEYLNKPIASTGTLSQEFQEFKSEESKFKPVRPANGFRQSEQLYEYHQEQLRCYRNLRSEEIVLKSDLTEQLSDLDQDKMEEIKKSLKEEQTALIKLREQLEMELSKVQNCMEVNEFVMVEMVNPSKVVYRKN